MNRIAVSIPQHRGEFVITAHVSGNQIDILHCPFCGSGAVIGRSDGTVECGYCTTVFTVQVQPQFNGFPQSVDSQPYQWPGQPPQGDPGLMEPNTPPGTDMAPAPGMSGPPQSSDPADGGGEFGEEGDEDGDEGDDSGNPFAKSDGGKGGSDKSDSKAPKSKGDGKKSGENPFAKKKSYLTVDGAELPADEFLAHLAIRHATNRLKAVQAVRSARERGEL